MGNPKCPKKGCKGMLQLRERGSHLTPDDSRLKEIFKGLKIRSGRSKTWVCPKCKSKFKAGAEVIRA